MTRDRVEINPVCSRPGSLAILWVLGVLLGIGASAQGTTIRHDRSDKKAVKLGLRSAFDAVGRIRGGGSAGSATLIGRQWAITAAHVVDGRGSVTFEVGGQSFLSSDVVVHKKWKGSVDRSAGFDLALVRLTQDVTQATRIKPAKLSKNKDPVGSSAWMVGHGLGGNGRKGFKLGSAEKRAGTNLVDDLSDKGRVMLVDFDDPKRKSRVNTLGDASATRFESLIAPGDSGGGLFIGKGNNLKLAGLHSFASATDGLVDSDYGDMAGHVNLARHLNWIERTIRKIERGTTSLAFDPLATDPTPLAGERLALSLALEPTAVPAPGTLACLAVGAMAGMIRRR